MKEMRLKYYDYQNDPIYNDCSYYLNLVLVLTYGDVNVADVCFEFSRPATKPSDDPRNGCNVYAQLSFQAAGSPVTTAVQAIYLALQTLDCSSYESIVREYVERGIPDDVVNGSNSYLVVDSSLYSWSSNHKSQ